MRRRKLFRQAFSPTAHLYGLPVLGLTVLGLTAAAALPATAESSASAASIYRGEKFVRENCAQCHAMDSASASPHPEAPALHSLGRRYPIEHLAEAFAEGVSVGHPDMPEFLILDPAQIEDLLAWLESIQM